MPTVGPRIPLSLHQRAVLGHADDRADRAGHRCGRTRPASARCRTRIRRASSSTPATCSASTSSPAGTASRAAAGQCRRPIHRAVQSRRLRQRPVRAVLSAVRAELVRGRRPDQHRPRQRPRHDALRLCRARCPTSRTRPSRSRRASASTRATSRCSAPNSKASVNFDRWIATRHVRQLRGAAGARLPGPPRGHPRQRPVQGHPELAAARARCATTCGPSKLNETQIGVGYIDDCLILALNYITEYAYNSTTELQSHGHAPDQPADDRREHGQPGRQRHRSWNSRAQQHQVAATCLVIACQTGVR